MIFAVLGDVHGYLDKAAEVIRQIELEHKVEIKFVLQVGDLEVHRHREDLASMYAPLREKHLGDFPEYLKGRKKFPRPMYFIGGNHESYGYLEEGPQGMTLAPNIYYLGRVGIRTILGLRVAYLTGIYINQFYSCQRKTRLQAIENNDWLGQSKLCCFRKKDVDVLYNSFRPDVLLVHEWPQGIVRPEDHEPGEPKHRRLCHKETGIPLVREIIEKTGPKLVLCGHLHRKYTRELPNDFGDRTLVHCLSHIKAKGEGWMLFAFDGQQLKEYLP